MKSFILIDGSTDRLWNTDETVNLNVATEKKLKKMLKSERQTNI